MNMLRASARKLTAYAQIRRSPIGYARSLGVKVGNRCRFLGLTPSTFGSEPYLITIGDHVTITHGVKFITHDGGVWVFRDEYPDIDVIAPIHVGNNVFIGVDAILMPGVSIGDNSIVGAGAIVTRDIPPNSVAAGMPARVIRSTSEYWERIEARAIHYRSLPPDEKRRMYEKLFLRKH